MKAPTKAREVLTDAVATLKASTAIDHWQRDREEIEADELLAYALGVDRVAPNREIPPNVRRRFDRMIARRASGEPVQLITGHAVFRGMQIAARPGVFVPRDSTEYLAEQAVRRLRGRRRPVAVDLATGGGTVALAIANEVPGVRVFGTDISLTAVRVARENAELLRLRATFAKGDLFGGLPSDLQGRVDVITLHPPYESPRWLKPGGWLLVEVSPDRARSAASVLRRNGFGDVRSTMDRGFKVTRVLVGRWRG